MALCAHRKEEQVQNKRVAGVVDNTGVTMDKIEKGDCECEATRER